MGGTKAALAIDNSRKTLCEAVASIFAVKLPQGGGGVAYFTAAAPPLFPLRAELTRGLPRG